MQSALTRLTVLSFVLLLCAGCASDDNSPDAGSADASTDTQSDADAADADQAYERIQSCGYVLRDLATDQLLSKVNHELDASGTLVRSESLPVDGGDTVYETTYTYDDLERLEQSVRDQASPEDVVEVSNYVYDADAKVPTTKRDTTGPTVDDQTLETRVEYAYDSFGTFETIEYYDANSDLRARTTVTWTEDRTVREAVQRDPDGDVLSRVEMTYSDNGKPLSRLLTSTLDDGTSLENRQTFVYDDQDRLATVEVYPNGASDDSPSYVYEYNYDCY